MGEMLFLSFPALLLIIAADNDIKHHKIPLSLIISGTVFFAAAPVFGLSLMCVVVRLTVSVCMSGLLVVVTLVCEWSAKKKLLGGGDILLIFVVSLYFDWTGNMYALFLSCVLAVISYILKRPRNRTEYFPAAPFLASGWLIVLLFKVVTGSM